MVELKYFESEENYDFESNPEGGKQIINAEPSATIATTKFWPSKPKELEEGECLFYSQMWVKGALLHFIVDISSQKNLISEDLIKQLHLPMKVHLHAYTIN